MPKSFFLLKRGENKITKGNQSQFKEANNTSENYHVPLKDTQTISIRLTYEPRACTRSNKAGRSIFKGKQTNLKLESFPRLLYRLKAALFV